MKHILQKYYRYVVAAILLVVLVIGAFVEFTIRAEQNLTAMCEGKLMEYAEHNAYCMTQELNAEMNLLKMATINFMDMNIEDTEEMRQRLIELKKSTSFQRMKIADIHGNCVDDLGITGNIAGYTHFQRTVLGASTIMGRDNNAIKDMQILVFSTPIIRDGRIIGTLHGAYNLDNISKIVKEQGSVDDSYSTILNSKGVCIFLTDSEKELNVKRENYWDFLKKVTFTQETTYEELYDSVLKRQSGYFTYRYGSEVRIAYYTPLGINDWYVVKMVSHDKIIQDVWPTEQLGLQLMMKMIALCVTGGILACILIVNINRKKNKELREAYQHAEKANHAKSTFLSRMSHEIRTPMNAIVGLTTLAHKHSGNQQRVEEYLTRIELSSRHLLEIINDVLDMAAIENEKIKIAEEKFDLKQVITSVTSLYYTQCKEKGINFRVIINGIHQEELMGDQLRLNQILLNLLSNALKFTEPKGSIKLIVSQTDTRLNGDTNKVFFRFEVKDNGCGMKKEYMDRIFQPFEQETATTAQEHGGTGLGLSITKSLVELMQGAISVSSNRGEGTTFVVELPFKPVEQPKERFGGDIRNIRALVIDDEQETLEYMATILDRFDIEYDMASDGEMALSYLMKSRNDNRPYALCLIDWKMPCMDGVALTKKIRALYDEGAIVVILSAYDVDEIRDEAEYVGADMCVSKPIFQSTMFNLLMSMTNGSMTRKTANVEEYDFTGTHILLAEDVEFNREIACELLQMVGIKVDCAMDGEEALQKFKDTLPGTYDIILMDVQMPNMDGYQATEAIRALGFEREDAKEIPILAMTANAFVEDVAKSLASGMNDHITKPIDTSVLYQVISKYVVRTQKS